MTRKIDEVLWKKSFPFQYRDSDTTPDFSKSKSPLVEPPPMPKELVGRKPSEIAEAARQAADRAVPIRRKR